MSAWAAEFNLQSRGLW